jgi:DNA-binding MarR family transcriptional regulator
VLAGKQLPEPVPAAAPDLTVTLTPAPSPSRSAARAILDEETAVRLRIAILRISRRLRPTDAGRAARLTPTRSSVLLTIVREGPLGLSALADGESLNPTMLSRVISELVEAGYVARVSDPGDRRAASVRCTVAGRRLAERIRRERTVAINAALSDLDAADRDALERALSALEGLAASLQERHA